MKDQKGWREQEKNPMRGATKKTRVIEKNGCSTFSLCDVKTDSDFVI